MLQTAMDIREQVTVASHRFQENCKSRLLIAVLSVYLRTIYIDKPIIRDAYLTYNIDRSPVIIRYLEDLHCSQISLEIVASLRRLRGLLLLSLFLNKYNSPWLKRDQAKSLICYRRGRKPKSSDAMRGIIAWLPMF
jgi:hypothetical protein